MSFGLVLFFQITLKNSKCIQSVKTCIYKKAKGECVSPLCRSPSVMWLVAVRQRLGALLKWKQRLYGQTTGGVSETEGDDSRRYRF